MIRYFPSSGDKHGWAIDEDRRLIRQALRKTAREAPLWSADVVHAPFWMALSMHHPSVLSRRFVIAHADNPPFFYLTQPEFARTQKTVDLWVARSSEAMEQFSALGLRAEHVPYAIDEKLFFPIADRAALREKYGIPREAYIVGNFHRDSEGADLASPKLQKAPETMVAILRQVRAAGGSPHVLLAGPRRHWIRRELAREGIPFTFVGKSGIEGDDFGINILSREVLNELYNACDLYLVPSRWEGGPQSAMEAAAARVKILSFPLGVARDILEPGSLFDAPSEAAAKIFGDMRENLLAATLEPQSEKLHANHTSRAMQNGLRRIYEKIVPELNTSPRGTFNLLADALRENVWQVVRRRPRRARRAVRLLHRRGGNAFLDQVMETVAELLHEKGVSTDGGGSDPAIAGSSGDNSQFRLLAAGGTDLCPDDPACRIALSVQDAVNFKLSGNTAPVVVCPFLFKGTGSRGSQLTIDEDNRGASLDVWNCLLDGGVPVYPETSAYYYEVFHGGVAYGNKRSREQAADIATRDAELFRSLARTPTRECAGNFLKTLLNE